MAERSKVHVPLPHAVEQLLQKICREQNQTLPTADVLQELASRGEEKALELLRHISSSKIKKSLGGFIHYMLRTAPYNSPQRMAGISPNPSPSSASRSVMSPRQGTWDISLSPSNSPSALSL
ncbi:hypothetical protein CJ030_MR5G018801 [Morella rubra]|uniref:RDRP3-5 N-terminal domain-containing protein n=1 Tax=Morella rubra TaxID=262757 RepID=A0A6A1VPI3_9ROSI|nr:hypothetical protein CJ030_MR5G018801 [Morella rubra]